MINELELEDSKDTSALENSVERPSKPGRYSDRLASLFEFLEEQEKPRNENDTAKFTACKGEHRASPIRTPYTSSGLTDITNNGCASVSSPGRCHAERKQVIASPYEKKLQSSNSDGKPFSSPRPVIATPSPAASEKSSSKYTGRSLRKNEKRYIWDDWEETKDGNMVFIRDLEFQEENKEADESKMGAGDVQTEKMPGGHQCLEGMAEEIQARASAMKAELNEKTSMVKDLRSTRVKNESGHVQKMQTLNKEWKKRFADLKARHDKIVNEQNHLQEELQNDCDILQKKVESLKTDIASIENSEKEACERLRKEGIQQLEEAKKRWQQAEKEELKKKDKIMSPKMKRDAAKAVEPKIHQLMEKHKEERNRLQREADRELDDYKMELYKKSNERFKREAAIIRDTEMKRREKLENEWMAKLEAIRIEHEAETKKVRKEFEQRMDMMKHQFRAEMSQRADQHKDNLEDANRAVEVEMENIRRTHELEMTAMEDEYAEKLVEKQHVCDEELKQWKVAREAELQKEEDDRVKNEHKKMEKKIQNDIDLVQRKLREEALEKQRKKDWERNEKMKVVKEAHEKELEKIENEIKQAEEEASKLAQDEQKATSLLYDLKLRLSNIEKSYQQKESDLFAQEERLRLFAQECDHEISQIKKDGERRVAQARNEVVALENELDELITSYPKRLEERKKEIEELKDRNDDEIRLAENKVAAMLENKKRMVEEASAKLFRLQQEKIEVNENLDEARKKKVLGSSSTK